MSLNYVVTDGAVSSGLSISGYYDFILVSGGTATESLITGGTMTVKGDDSLADKTTVNGSARIIVDFGGRITDTDMTGEGRYSSASLTLSSGIANRTTLNSAAYLEMRYGATAYDTVVNSGGNVGIYGGTAFNAIVNSSGSINNYSGTIQGATVTTWGDIQVTQSGVVSNALLTNGGHMYASKGGNVFNTVVDSQSYLSISGGTATNTVVNSGGSMYQTEGRVEGATVNQGGYFSAGFGWYGIPEDLSSIGAVNVVENGGNVQVGSGSKYDEETSSWVSGILFPVSFQSNTFSGLVYGNDYAYGTVHSHTTAVDITALAGGLTVYEGGIVKGYTIGYWEGEPDEGGYVESSAGSINVRSGGTATGIIANLPDKPLPDNIFCTFEIAPGTVISGTFGGTGFGTTIGVVENTSIRNANMIFLNGATVTNFTEVFGSATVNPGAIVNGITLSAARINVESNAVVNGLTGIAVPYTTSEYTGVPWEEDSGEWIEVETVAGAYVRIDGGATVTNMNLDADSPLYLVMNSRTVVAGTSGGNAFNVSNGYFGNAELNNTTIMQDEGTLENLVLNNGAFISAYDGTNTLNIVENGGAIFLGDDYNEAPTGTHTFVEHTFSGMTLDGNVTVHKNTVASNNIMEQGELEVFSGGIVHDFYTGGGGMKMSMVNFHSGAIGSNIDMTRYFKRPAHGGHAWFESDVQVSKLRLNTDDFVDIVVSPTTVITNGAVDLKPFSIENGVLSGYQTGGMNDETTILQGGKVIDSFFQYGGLYLQGGSAENITLDTTVYVSSGSILSKAQIGVIPTEEVYGGGGNVYLYEGGVLRDFTMVNDSYVSAGSGAKITGRMRIAEGGGTIYIGGSATVDFDLTAKDALDGARINDMSALRIQSNDMKYTITIDGMSQAGGEYLLGQRVNLNGYSYFHVVDATGVEYGCYEGYWTEEWDEETETWKTVYKTIYTPSVAQPEYGFSLGVVEDPESDYYNLVFTVDSEIAPTAWLEAPTITADIATFTDQDVTLAGHFSPEAVKQEYSLDGTTWQAYDGLLTVTSNGTYYFRGADINGTYSDVTTFTVSNIDKVAPTVATGLTVAYDEESNVVLSWTDATDDFSGVAGFQVSFWQDGGEALVRNNAWTNLTVDGLANGTWHWGLQTVDYAGNLSNFVSGADFAIGGGTVSAYHAKGDVDGNGVSDVLFQYTGGDYQLGYWMNGTNTWRGQGLSKPAEWEVLGSYDMNNNGNADAVLVGNVEVGGVKGAYIGYYLDSVDTDANWQNIGYLNNADNIGWKNKVGNLTGTDGANSIVWYAPELYALGVWLDGTDSWVTLSANFGGNEWTLVGCGDFAGTGRDTVLMTYNNGQLFYTVDITGTASLLTASDLGWEVRAIGDFSGDKKDDIIAFHSETGLVAMWGDGSTDNWSLVGQLDANDWFIVGAGDYNGDKKDDLLVRQISTGMLGYYSNGDMAQWNTLGYGVDMNWTVIA